MSMTTMSLTQAKAHLNEIARRVHGEHERVALTRNGETEAVLLAPEDLEGLEITLEILSDSEAATRITESLQALERGGECVDLETVQADFARRRAHGA